MPVGLVPKSQHGQRGRKGETTPTKGARVPYFEGLDAETCERVMDKLVASTCAAFALELTAWRFVGHSENVVCRLTARAGGRARAYALRVGKPGRYSTAQIEAECAWINAIARETPVRCLAPLTTRDGAHVAEIPVPELAAHRRCSLFPWVTGAQVDEPQPDHLRQLGETTAALHNHADVYSRGARVDRPSAEWPDILARFLKGDLTAAWEDHQGPAMTDDARAVFAEAAARVRAEAAAFPTDADHGLIHADLHLHNVVYADGDLWPIDFDDCQYGHYMTDAATTLFHLGRPRGDGQQPLVDAYFEGYVTGRRLPADWERQVATFGAVRFFSMADWILSWRREDHMGPGSAMLASFATHLRDYLTSPA